MKYDATALFVLPQCTNSSMVYNMSIVLSAKEC